MSAHEPLDPASDRQKLRKWQPDERAFDVLPDEREEPRKRGDEGAAFEEVRGNEGRDGAISRIATSQNGAVTRAQLLQAGLEQSGIGRRSDRGLLHRVHRGVYVFGHEALAPYARETAALLAVGDRTVISHSSSAILWGFAAAVDGDDDVHVTVVGRLHLHYAATLDRRDFRRVQGLPVTSPARTLFDLAATGYRQLDRAFGDAHAQRLVTAREMEQLLERVGPRAGKRAIRDLLSDNASGFTRSEAERLLRNLFRAANLPMALFNTRVAGYEVDAVWPEQRVIVEVDGYAYHGHRGQFERDRKKDLALRAAGYTVIRVSWRQLTKEPFALVAVLSAELSLGRKPG